MLGRNNQLANGMGNKIGMQNGFPPPSGIQGPPFARQ